MESLAQHQEVITSEHLILQYINIRIHFIVPIVLHNYIIYNSKYNGRPHVPYVGNDNRSRYYTHVLSATITYSRKAIRQHKNTLNKTAK